MSFGTLRYGPSSERRETTQGFSFFSFFLAKYGVIFELWGEMAECREARKYSYFSTASSLHLDLPVGI